MGFWKQFGIDEEQPITTKELRKRVMHALAQRDRELWNRLNAMRETELVAANELQAEAEKETRDIVAEYERRMWAHTKEERAQAQAPSRAHVKGVFTVLALFAPKRIMDEEVGDAMEVISALHNLPTRWRRAAIYLKVATTVVWVLINGVREVCAAVLGKKKSGG